MQTRLAEFADAVHELLLGAGIDIPKRDDVEALQQHDEARRIVWLTPGGAIEAPRMAGAQQVGSMRVRICKVRVEHVDAHIFGVTRADAEQILDRVIAAVFTLSELCEMPTYRYTTQVREQSGRALRVHECVLRVNLRLPVPDEISPLREVVAVEDHCGTIQSDGSIRPQD